MIVSNDLNRDRVKALVGNFHRLGITNSVITSHDGRAFPKVLYFVFCVIEYIFGPIINGMFLQCNSDMRWKHSLDINGE